MWKGLRRFREVVTVSRARGLARRCGAAVVVRCAAVIMCASIALAACGRAGEAPTGNAQDPSGEAVQVPIERPEWSSQLGGVRERTRTVIRDRVSWQAFWESFAGARTPRPDPPDVDFERHVVIIAAMGEQSTAGHGIAIENVYEENGTTRVEVVETVPAGGCLTAQVITTPTTAVLIPTHAAEVEFVERRETRSC